MDARTDVYSLGVVLYEVLTGEPPFRGTNTALLQQVLIDDPPSLRRYDDRIPRDLETVCLKAMAKRLGDRYATAGDLAADLRRYLAGEPIRARPVPAWGRFARWVRRRPAAAALVAISGIAALALVGVGVGVGVAYNVRLQTVNQDLVAARAAEAGQRRRADETAYAQRLALASREWAGGNVERVGELLAECPADLRGWEWGYLSGLLHRDLLIITHRNAPNGPEFSVLATAYRPDGRWIADASWDGSVRVWDADTGRPVRELQKANTAGAFCVAWSPSGEFLAAGSGDGTVRVWEADTGRLAHELRGPVGCVYGLAYSPDGKQLAAGGGDPPANNDLLVRHPGCAWVWSLPAGEISATLGGLPQPAVGVAFHPDGRRVAVADGLLRLPSVRVAEPRPGVVAVWDTVAGVVERRLAGPAGPLTGVAVSPDGTRVAASGWDRTAVVWDAVTGVRAATLAGHRDRVNGLAFAPGGGTLATAGADGVVRVWDAATGQEVRGFRGHLKAATCIAYRPDGGRLASGSSDQTIKIWNPAADPQSAIVHLGGPVAGLGLVADGTTVAVAVNRPTPTHEVRAWLVTCAPDGRKLGEQLSDGPRVVSLAACPTRAEVATGLNDGSVRVWDVRGGVPRVSGRLVPPEDEHQPVLALAYSPDGGRIAAKAQVFDTMDNLTVWDPLAGRIVNRLADGLYSPLTSAAYFPDGRTVALARERTVSIWDPVGGKEVSSFPAHARVASVVSVSPRGDTLATGGWDYTAKLWDVAKVGPGKPREPRAVLRGHTGRVLTATFTPDGRRLATGGDDAAIKLWDVATGQEVLTLTGHGGPVVGVAFDPAGRTLLSGSEDGTVRMWRAPVADAAGRR